MSLSLKHTQPFLCCMYLQPHNTHTYSTSFFPATLSTTRVPLSAVTASSLPSTPNSSSNTQELEVELEMDPVLTQLSLHTLTSSCCNSGLHTSILCVARCQRAGCHGTGGQRRLLGVPQCPHTLTRAALPQSGSAVVRHRCGRRRGEL